MLKMKNKQVQKWEGVHQKIEKHGENFAERTTEQIERIKIYEEEKTETTINKLF